MTALLEAARRDVRNALGVLGEIRAERSHPLLGDEFATAAIEAGLPIKLLRYRLTQSIERITREAA